MIKAHNPNNLPTIDYRDLIELQPNSFKDLSQKNFDKLSNSFNVHGFITPYFVWKDKGKHFILDGHQRSRVLSTLEPNGLEVPYILIEAKNKQEAAKKLLAIDSRYGKRTAEGEQEFLDIFEIEQGYIEEVAVLEFEFEEAEEEIEAEEDDFDEAPPETPITVLGDLYEIGEHRLLCGDSTDSDQVAKLMNGSKAEISFTSPPYNAGTTPTEIKMGKTSKYANDSDNKTESEYLNLLIDFTNNTLLFSDYSFVNIQSLSGNKTALIDFLYNMKSFYADTLIWQKQNAQPAMAENVLNSQFEYIHVFSHKANRAIGTKQFRGTLSNVLDISKQNKNVVKEHNATFPIDFAAHFVQNFCENSVLDLFLGSGTTMVASHQLKRKCYGMELDCRYADVIVKRMLKLDKTLNIKKNGIDETEKWLSKINEASDEEE